MIDAQLARKVKELEQQIREFRHFLDRIPGVDRGKDLASLKELWSSLFQQNYVLVPTSRPATSPRDFNSSYRTGLPRSPDTQNKWWFIAYPQPEKVSGYDLYLNGELVGFLVVERVILESEDPWTHQRQEDSRLWMITGKRITKLGKVSFKPCRKATEFGEHSIARYFESSATDDILLHYAKLYASMLFSFHTNRGDKEIFQEIKVLEGETRMKEEG